MPEQNNSLQIVRVAAILTVLFIIYNTLIPFRPYTETGKIIRNILDIEWMPYFEEGHLTSLTDIVGNIILFIPLGFFFFMYAHLRNRERMATAKIVLAGFLLSSAIEISQLVFRYRITTITDIINNTLGTLTGVLAARIYLALLSDWFRERTQRILSQQPLTLALLLMIAVELLSSLIPFNVSITVSDLKKSIAYSNITPFEVKSFAGYFGHPYQLPESVQFSWTGFIGNMFFYVFYGYILFYVYSVYWKGGRGALLKLAVFMTLYFPFIELLQFFIRSRFSDINDIISGFAGAVAGMILYYLTGRGDAAIKNKPPATGHFKIIIFLYFIFVFYKGMAPFRFSLSPQVILQDFNIRHIVPFYAYYKVTSLWNIYDIIETFFLTVPLGIILALRSSEPLAPGLRRRGLLAGLVIGLVIETAQIFLRTRTADITDVFFMMAGAGIGVYFYQYYYENYGQPAARSRENTATGSIK